MKIGGYGGGWNTRPPGDARSPWRTGESIATPWVKSSKIKIADAEEKKKVKKKRKKPKKKVKKQPKKVKQTKEEPLQPLEADFR